MTDSISMQPRRQYTSVGDKEAMHTQLISLFGRNDVELLHTEIFPCVSQAIVNCWDLIFDPSCCESKCIPAYFKLTFLW